MKKTGTIIKENTFIISTFINNYLEITESKLRNHIQQNCDILKDRLNQESILVEITEPKVIFC